MDMRDTIGLSLTTKFKQFSADRQQLEIQWIKNLRQYRRKYDPEIESLIPSDRSKVYPGETRTKVNGFTAKMMEMMFPAAETNFTIQPTPNPNLDKASVDAILKQVTQSGEVVDEATVNTAIESYAKEAAHAMETEIKDQLADLGGAKIDHPQLAKKVILSGCNYGFGVVIGPQVRTQRETKYKMDPVTNEYKAFVVDERRPFFEFSRVFDIYPDLSAPSWWDQEGIFQRIVLKKSDLQTLMKREDYDSTVIRQFIKDHSNGNYTEQTYENDLNAIKNISNVNKSSKVRFEIIRYFGFVPGSELKQAGASIKDDEIDYDVLADISLLGDKVIKLDKAPFGDTPSDIFHAFIFSDEDDGPVTGTALVEVLRDSQLKLCAVDRATMDNMGASAGPITEINEDLIAPNQGAISIHSFSTIRREGRGQEAGYPAIRSIDIPSHLPELLSLRNTIKETFDVESNLPSWLMGDSRPLGEAFRTSNNMSMMQGGANMVVKDVVRSFDRFTESVIGSLVKWNMRYNEKKEIKGDFQVRAKGNLSLVAKEVRGAALEQFIQSLTEDERAILKTRDTLVERLRSRDLPEDILVSKSEAATILQQRQMIAQQQQQKVDNETVARTQSFSAKASKDMATANSVASTIQANIAEILARVEMYMSNAKGTQDRGKLESIKLLLEQLEQKTANAGLNQRVKN